MSPDARSLFPLFPRPRVVGWAAVAAALTLVAGCAHARGVPATMVRSGAQCGGAGQGPSARWLANEESLREVLAAEGPLALSGPTQSHLAVDFTQQGVVLVSTGRKSTAGHAVTLAATEAEQKDGIATLAVRFDEPPPGAVLAQVVTSPCLLVALPRAGLREVRVVDAAGVVRATAPVAR